MNGIYTFMRLFYGAIAKEGYIITSPHKTSVKISKLVKFHFLSSKNVSNFKAE